VSNLSAGRARCWTNAANPSWWATPPPGLLPTRDPW